VANVFFELRHFFVDGRHAEEKAPVLPMLRGQGDGVNRVDEVSGALGTVERWKGAALRGKLWCVEMAAWSLEPNGGFFGPSGFAAADSVGGRIVGAAMACSVGTTGESRAAARDNAHGLGDCGDGLPEKGRPR